MCKNSGYCTPKYLNIAPTKGIAQIEDDEDDDDDDDGTIVETTSRDDAIAQMAQDNPIGVDALLAKDLNQMSLNEREKVCEQIHGVESILEESDEMISSGLNNLEMELQKIPSKPAYDEAERMSSEYVRDRKFRLMFLRAEQFDSSLAARRLVMFMEEKAKNFGRESLTRPLNLRDLDKDDLETLNSGVFQALPVRDTAGRLVIVGFEKLIPYRCYKKAENMVCMLMSLMLNKYH